MSLLLNEHQALVRQWGRLQTQIDAVLKDQARQQATWISELMQLRAQLIIRDTQAFWGLGFGLLPRPHPAKQEGPRHAPSVKQVICQSGCVSQAHTWLDNNDQCRLYGGTCDNLSLKTVKPCA
jgi:hypothetical protein